MSGEEIHFPFRYRMFPLLETQGFNAKMEQSIPYVDPIRSFSHEKHDLVSFLFMKYSIIREIYQRIYSFYADRTIRAEKLSTFRSRTDWEWKLGNNNELFVLLMIRIFLYHENRDLYWNQKSGSIAVPSVPNSPDWKDSLLETSEQEFLPLVLRLPTTVDYLYTIFGWGSYDNLEEGPHPSRFSRFAIYAISQTLIFSFLVGLAKSRGTTNHQ